MQRRVLIQRIDNDKITYKYGVKKRNTNSKKVQVRTKNTREIKGRSQSCRKLILAELDDAVASLEDSEEDSAKSNMEKRNH